MAEPQLDGSKVFLERLDGDEWHDEIRISTVPRFKTSGLSGDEWRTSAQIEIRRKGRLVYERTYHQIGDAARHLPWLLLTYAEPGEAAEIDPDMTRDLCMQPGCPQWATVLYRKIRQGCGRCGHRRDVDDQFPRYRAFCRDHAVRGNSDLDDMDDIYELVAGQPGQVPPAAISRSQFAGSVMLDDLPAFLARLRKGDESGG
jgi:hypothetical protein